MLETLLAIPPQFIVSLTREEQAIASSNEFLEARRIAIEKSFLYDRLYLSFLSRSENGDLKRKFSGFDDGFLFAYKRRAEARNCGIWASGCNSDNLKASANLLAGLAEFVKRYTGSDEEDLLDFYVSDVFQSLAAGERAGYCGLVCTNRGFCSRGEKYQIDTGRMPGFCGNDFY